MGKTINPLPYNTDKPSFDVYFRNYERQFGPLAGKKIHLLELGISQGGSLELWRDYFRSGTIAGIDISPVRLDDPTGRIHVYQGLQQDTALLDRVRRETAPDGFDIIIDDCSHIGEFTALSFWHLFDNHLKPGGVYVIEDWGAGYMRGTPDGRAYVPPRSVTSFRSMLRPFVERVVARPSVVRRPALKRVVHAVMNRLVRMRFRSHMYGLVGFVKQLVDEAGMDDITHPAWGTPPARASKFSYIQVSHGQVFIAKAGVSAGPAVPPGGSALRRSVRVSGPARRRLQTKKRRTKKP
ncbi:MAG TPA: class I SAM-dependent methyltransferase [Bacteroidota bacterium]